MLQGRAFKAIRPRDLPEAWGLANAYRPASPRSHAAPALLLDCAPKTTQVSAGGSVYGGSGQPADWPIGRALARGMPLLLAGGLRPDNVAQAIVAVKPWGVDVASGVERSPGIKDPEKMAAFIRMAKAVWT